MPKNRLQETIFTIMMVIVMVYGMVFYNITIAKGAFSADTLANWGRAILINLPMAFGWQLLVAGPIVRKIFGTIMAKRAVRA